MPKKADLKCYFGCKLDGPLHRFPKWEYPQIERCTQWQSVLTPATQKKGYNYIYHSVRICYRHFEVNYRLPSRRLTLNAIPTLNISLLQHYADCVMSSTSVKPVQPEITDKPLQLLINSPGPGRFRCYKRKKPLPLQDIPIIKIRMNKLQTKCKTIKSVRWQNRLQYQNHFFHQLLFT